MSPGGAQGQAQRGHLRLSHPGTLRWLLRCWPVSLSPLCPQQGQSSTCGTKGWVGINPWSTPGCTENSRGTQHPNPAAGIMPRAPAPPRDVPMSLPAPSHPLSPSCAIPQSWECQPVPPRVPGNASPRHPAFPGMPTRDTAAAKRGFSATPLRKSRVNNNFLRGPAPPEQINHRAAGGRRGSAGNSGPERPQGPVPLAGWQLPHLSFQLGWAGDSQEWEHGRTRVGRGHPGMRTVTVPPRGTAPTASRAGMEGFFLPSGNVGASIEGTRGVTATTAVPCPALGTIPAAGGDKQRDE